MGQPLQRWHLKQAYRALDGYTAVPYIKRARGPVGESEVIDAALRAAGVLHERA
jgi:hypothetical protein